MTTNPPNPLDEVVPLATLSGLAYEVEHRAALMPEGYAAPVDLVLVLSHLVRQALVHVDTLTTELAAVHRELDDLKAHQP